MALRAIDLGSLEAPTIAAAHATIHEFAPMPRMVAIAAARRERRRWLVLAGVVFLTPLAACLGVLEVVR
jgi:hypothetical protein